ncbi:SCO family protein [Aliikangiella marina]|uniref:SCO family protein n=1 Tax=Aliikangiella marina TaxID=1712262 RepID=A0A545T971_9GAMM|nr:SCO family protein [Aliikangiella marina]TQV73764.1 SCO family protein [Aliikangiella marina]
MNKVLFIVLSLLMLNACSDSGKSPATVNEQPFTQMLVYPKKNPLAPFELSADDKTEFNQASFKGKWNLLFMGFTNCPDICPTTMTDMAHIYNGINSEVQKNFRVVFLSVDPKRDTLEHMDEYLNFFHKDFIGITGKTEEIDKLVYSLGGIYVIGNEDENYYSVDHTARIFIVSPQGERYGMIRSDVMRTKDWTLLIEELNELGKTTG